METYFALHSVYCGSQLHCFVKQSLQLCWFRCSLIDFITLASHFYQKIAISFLPKIELTALSPLQSSVGISLRYYLPCVT